MLLREYQLYVYTIIVGSYVAYRLLKWATRPTGGKDS